MRRLLGLALLIAVGTGCGGIIGKDTNFHAAPRMMREGDVGTACASGEALGGTLEGFAKGKNETAKALVSVRQSSAMCLDEPVWEADLAYLRAFQKGDVPAAKDALAVAQRKHAVAAQRNHTVWKWLVQAYGVPGPDEACPKLRAGHDHMDELIYLLGLSSGVTAVLHDNASGGMAGVPMDIPAAVVRGAACLDNERWWGAPAAMQSSVLALMPDAPGVEKDPWLVLDESFAKGAASGVRLASAFRAQTASALDRTEIVRRAITEHAESLAAKPADPAWLLLDRYATLIVQQESDRIWTQLTGHRTPTGALGTFPDDAAVPEEALDDSLFNDFLQP